MTDIRHETMRIGGEHVDTDARVEVRYPYTDEVIGTVPAGTAEHARKAFEIAANYQSKLTRYERSQILQRAGEIIGERRDYLAKWLTLELGICYQHSIYETKRAQDVYQFAAAEALKDWWLFQRTNGPAGVALGTTDSTPLALGPVPFETGVIAGTRSLAPRYALLFDGPHDGKVAVARAHLRGAGRPADHAGPKAIGR